NKTTDRQEGEMAAWFSAFSAGSGNQLYTFGRTDFADDIPLQWTANPGFMGSGLDPHDLTFFNNALWFSGETPANEFQLFKLGSDGSVTQWTSIAANFGPQDLTIFNDALWFQGLNAGQFQLFKLGNDGSVTQWTANPGFMGFGLNPLDLTVFNDALWFDGA